MLRGFQGSARDHRVGLEFPREVADAFGFAVDEEVVDLPVAGVELSDLGEVVRHESRVVGGKGFGPPAGDGLALLVQEPEVVP